MGHPVCYKHAETKIVGHSQVNIFTYLQSKRMRVPPPPNLEVSVSNLEFSKRGMGKSFKVSTKLCIFEKIGEAIIQLFIGRSISYFELLSVVAIIVQTLFIMLFKIWNVARKEKIHFNYLLKRTERAR